MSYDPHKNFAYSTVLTAPSPATSGTSVVLQSGDGANFPAAPFNITIWPAGAQPTPANAEIARCTVKATDTLTITRAQESSSARTVVVGDQIAATITAKTLTDIEVPGANLGTSSIATSQSTTSSTFGDLGTVGPSVTVTIGANGAALVSVACEMFNSTTDYCLVGMVVSGANTIAVKQYLVNQGNTDHQMSNTFLLTGLSAGATTFKMQYANVNNSSTATFANRQISVIPY